MAGFFFAEAAYCSCIFPQPVGIFLLEPVQSGVATLPIKSGIADRD